MDAQQTKEMEGKPSVDFQFEDFLPVMAEKLGEEGLMEELCNGFRLLADPKKGIITFHGGENIENNPYYYAYYLLFQLALEHHKFSYHKTLHDVDLKHRPTIKTSESALNNSKSPSKEQGRILKINLVNG